jgi:glycosyltransferase involved in cell wall biosynthesis
VFAKNSHSKNNFFVVTNAVNEKNGANGSMIDLIIALRKTSNVRVFTLARPPIIGLWESFLNLGIVSYSWLLLSIYRHILNKPEVIFFIGNASLKQILSFKNIYPDAKLMIFQTGDVKNNELEFSKIDILDYVLFESPGQMDDFNNTYKNKQDKSILLRPTIKEKKFNPTIQAPSNIDLSNNNVIINFVIIGSIQERKNQLLAIQFCQILKEKYDINLKLTIVGPFVDKNYKELIENFVSENILDDYIIFTGFQKRYSDYLCHADIVLSFSKEEGLSTIIREALYLGKLIVATNIPGNAGTLNAENSILFDLNNNIDVLVNDIIFVLSDRDKTHVMVNRAKKTYLTNHGIKKYSEELKRIICNVI